MLNAKRGAVVEIHYATIEVAKLPTSFSLTQIEEKSTCNTSSSLVYYINNHDCDVQCMQICGIAMAIVAWQCG